MEEITKQEYDLVKLDNPILRKKVSLSNLDKTELTQIVNQMFEKLASTVTGIGLAAPQVGLDLALFIIQVNGIKQEFINPVIEKEWGKEFEYIEGCLSIPGVHVPVMRKPNILISFYDKDLVKHTEEFGGMVARVIQHEYDHLQGVLITDYEK